MTQLSARGILEKALTDARLARDFVAIRIYVDAITAALAELDAMEREYEEWLDLVLAMNGLPKGATLYHTVDGGWTLYTKDGGGRYEAGQRIAYQSTGDLFDGIMGITRDPADAILGKKESADDPR